ncbi:MULTISPECIES: ABC transporter ATP-binding protein [Candidatus Ichthyocystis]|nr:MULTISPECIES: ATP-binding cassette domain-containing protein [Ichthyocystis]
MYGFSGKAIHLSGVDFFREETRILSDISLSVNYGEIVAVMGFSGGGKTTLIELMAGLLFPSKGYVEVCKLNLSHCSLSDLFSIRRQMGILFQTGALFSDLSVFDNVAFPLREITSFSGEAISDLTWMKLEAVGLRSAATLFPSELSGGMARRVSLARAISLDPRILLCDEPFSGLDPAAVNSISNLILSLTRIFNLSTVIITHHVGDLINIFDRVLLLVGGSLVFDGTPGEFLSSEKNEVQSFIRGDVNLVHRSSVSSLSLAENLRIVE